MSYCFDHALPHSRFLDEWDVEDREKLMAFMVEKSERCQMCGTAPWEWEEDRFAYEPLIEVCQGCQAKDMMREDVKGAGSSVILVPKAQAERKRSEPKKIGARGR